MPTAQYAWIFLILAGLFEIGWPVGLKMAQTPGKVLPGTAAGAEPPGEAAGATRGTTDIPGNPEPGRTGPIAAGLESPPWPVPSAAAWR